MFDYIKIEGFRSFKHVALEMPRLAVLIGPNGGGKSNLLDSLMLLSEAGRGELNLGINGRGGFRDVAFGFDPSHEVRIEFRFTEVLDQIFQPAALPPDAAPDKRAPCARFWVGLRSVGSNFRVWEEQLRVERPDDASLSIPIAMVRRDATQTIFVWSQGHEEKDSEPKTVIDVELAISQVRDANNYPVQNAILQQFQGWTFYRDIDVGPDSPVRQPALLRSDIRLSPNGSNLSSVFYAIQQDHPDSWAEILEIVHTAYPEFERLTVRGEGGDGKVILRWSERPFEQQAGLSANLLSDGTLKLLCLIAILKNPTPPPLICIDEPELGLHPDWIELVAELLQDAAMRTQVIVATHSPHIVAKMKPEQVIVAEKENGETSLTHLSAEDLEKWLRDFNLAELWLAGHFGGRP
ncbi:MAG: AAA family ATPase [Terriglobia bacterium]|jgi:predicted ATPase